jgi:hypothetical protein
MSANRKASAEQRMQMVRKLEEGRHYSETVGRHLVALLDRTDGQRKAMMIGEVFKALAQNEIDQSMFYRLIYSIERLLLSEVPSARNILEEGELLLGDSADAIRLRQEDRLFLIRCRSISSSLQA